MKTKRPLGWLLAALWAVLAVVINALRYDLMERLNIFGVIFPLALWIGFVGLLAAAVVGLVKKRSSTAFACVVLLTGLCVWVYGQRLGTLARFHALKPRYESVVAALADGRDPGIRVAHRVEQGPPLRVAFPWPGGILDNWCGVVYDPSGLVMKARPLKPDLSSLGAPDLQKVRALFGGDLFYCEPLGGNWYFCSFT